VSRIAFAGAETRSFKRAAIVMDRVGGQGVSAKTIERIVHDVGAELAARRDADADAGVEAVAPLARRPEGPPELAVVECDGGRIRTREPDQGPGVHRSGEGWRETKNACLIRAVGATFEDDPHPEPPACFSDPKHVARIVEAEAPATSKSATPPEPEAPDVPDAPTAWPPKRLVRTVLASLADPRTFGEQMGREARRRRFPEAPARVFLGDGLPWNWSIWKRRFPDFTPVLDFIHALSYLFLAARAAHEKAEDAWDQYLAWMRGAWQGEITQVIEELEAWRTRQGPPPDDAPENDPRKVIARTITYLTNNRQRMRYPDYRRAGLPVTTAWMESLVKEMNYRTKGTEMFWNDPEGAEAILQVRAAALCDDDRLATHLDTRPGQPFTRRPKSPKPSPQEIKG
jgi:hypothetical protein